MPSVSAALRLYGVAVRATRRSLGRMSMLHECFDQNRMLRPEDRREVRPRLCSGYRSEAQPKGEARRPNHKNLP